MEDLPPPGYVPAESAISGITVFKPAPEEERLDEVVDFRCPQCGGETAYSVADGGLTCTYCGYHEAPHSEVVGLQAESFEFTVATVEQSVNGWGVDRTELQCQSCSAHISIPAGSLTAACPFCGSNKVIHQRAPQDLLRPRFLVPFKVEESRCHAITREWLGSSWMVPKQLRTVASIDSFAALFLPYWTFGSSARASWRAQVGHTKSYTDSRGRRRTRTEWHWESGQVRRDFQDLLIRGTDRISSHLLNKIGRFSLNDLTAYEPAFLAGTQAQAYEVTLEEAWEKARHLMRETTRHDCRRQASTNKIRNFSMQLDFQDESWRYILLPVYINSYRYENEPYQLLINGQTGEIAGQRPVDWRKVGLVAAGLILPGILVFLILLLLFPEFLESGGAILSFVLFAAGVTAAAVIAFQAQKMDDV
jgi:DNA-directed RNA polymerase subunit RPC12/RpoP